MPSTADQTIILANRWSTMVWGGLISVLPVTHLSVAPVAEERSDRGMLGPRKSWPCKRLVRERLRLERLAVERRGANQPCDGQGCDPRVGCYVLPIASGPRALDAENSGWRIPCWARFASGFSQTPWGGGSGMAAGAPALKAAPAQHPQARRRSPLIMCTVLVAVVCGRQACT